MSNPQKKSERRLDSSRRRVRYRFRPTPEGLESRVVLTRLNLAQIFGNLTTDNINDAPTPFGIQFSGQRPNGGLGYSVEMIGDVNNDGFEDMAIGEPIVNLAGTPPGLGTGASRVYVVFGSRNTNSVQDFLDNLPSERAAGLNSPTDAILTEIGGEQFTEIGQNNYVNGLDGFDFDGLVFETPNIPGSQLGASIAALGDIDGDNIDDFAIGAPGAPTLSGLGDPTAGRVYVVFGTSALNGVVSPFNIDVPVADNSTVPATQIPRITTILYRDGGIGNTVLGQDLGFSVAGLGNALGTGRNDLIIGDPTADSSDPVGLGSAFHPDGGMAYIIDGRDIPNAQIASDATNRRLLLEDILNAAPGSTSLNSLAVPGTQDFELFGFSVASASNIDSVGNPTNSGTEFNEILIGSPNFAGAGLQSGRAFLIYGASDLFAARRPLTPGSVIQILDPERVDPNLTTVASEVVPGAVFEGDDQFDRFGFSVSTAGRFNSDQFNDFMIGAPQANNFDGRVTLIYGRANTSTAPGRISGRYIVTANSIAAQTGASAAPGFTQIEGEDLSFSEAGFSISAVGPTRGGSFDRNSILIGAPLFNFEDGRAYLIPGTDNLGTSFDLEDVVTAAADTGQIAFDRTPVIGESEIFVGNSVSGHYDLNSPNTPKTQPTADQDAQFDYIIGASGFRLRSLTTPALTAAFRAGGAFFINAGLADPSGGVSPPPPPGGGGNPSAPGATSFFRQNRLAELAISPFAESFFPERRNLSKFNWRPLPQRVVAQQYRPRIEFQLRAQGSKALSRKADRRTVGDNVFYRGKTNNGVKPFKHPGNVIPLPNI